MVRTLYLIRHASVEGPDRQSYRGRYLGRTDVPLSMLGIEQARALGPEFRKLRPVVDGPVWSSPLLRCRETWGEMGLAGAPVILDDLQEVDFGAWEGKSFPEIVADSAPEVERWNAFDPDFRFPRGESLGGFVDRIERLRKRLLETDSRELVCITHGGVISMLICLLLGLNPSQYLAFHVERASIASLVVFRNGLGRLTGLNLGATSAMPRPLAGEWPL